VVSYYMLTLDLSKGGGKREEGEFRERKKVRGAQHPVSLSDTGRED